MRTRRRSRSPRRRAGAAAASLVRDMGVSPALSPLQQRHDGDSRMRSKRGSAAAGDAEEGGRDGADAGAAAGDGDGASTAGLACG